MFSIADVIEIAIQIEKNGEKLLRSSQRKATDPKLISLFQWIADEEVRHAESFAGMRPTGEEKRDTAELDAMGRELLRDMMAQENFSLNENELTRFDRMESLLSKMIEFEQDTVIFYEMIRSFVSDAATTGAVDEIITQEKRHAATLKGFLAKSRQ
ncbi:MAG: hypothetical protein C4530_01920 [Desulfobacteraceae bacterium]|nr:MAG: hypothetical protein C4530_01920 [Desulfobacteraceae bacterium]